MTWEELKFKMEDFSSINDINTTGYAEEASEVANRILKEKLYLMLLTKINPVLEFYSDQNEWVDFKSYGWIKDGSLKRVNSHFDFDNGLRARVLLASLNDINNK